jgi:hypothetical protein
VSGISSAVFQYDKKRKKNAQSLAIKILHLAAPQLIKRRAFQGVLVWNWIKSQRVCYARISAQLRTVSIIISAIVVRGKSPRR